MADTLINICERKEREREEERQRKEGKEEGRSHIVGKLS